MKNSASRTPLYLFVLLILAGFGLYQWRLNVQSRRIESARLAVVQRGYDYVPFAINDDMNTCTDLSDPVHVALCLDKFSELKGAYPELIAAEEPNRPDYAVVERLVSHYDVPLEWALASEWNYAYYAYTLQNGNSRAGYEIMHLESEGIPYALYGKPDRDEAFFGRAYRMWGETNEEKFVDIAVIDNQWDGGQINGFIYETVRYRNSSNRAYPLGNISRQNDGQYVVHLNEG